MENVSIITQMLVPESRLVSVYTLVAQTIKSLPAIRRPGFDPCIRKIPWRRKWQLFRYSCLENHVDGGAWWAKEVHTTERLTHTHTHTHTHTEKELNTFLNLQSFLTLPFHSVQFSSVQALSHVRLFATP